MKRIFNANLFTPDAEFVPGEVHVAENGRIAYVGKTPETLPDFTETIDARGGYLLPGFKNAHTHSAMTFLRCRADDLPLDRWLNEVIFPREAHLTADDVYWLTKLAVLEYVRGGTTACFDMYFHTDAFAAAMTECGFRAVLCGSAMAFDTDPINTLSDLYDKWQDKEKLVTSILGFHGEYTSSPELLAGIRALAEAHRAPVFVHNSETKKEVDECIARHGKTPTEYIADSGLWEYGGGGFHCVHLSENDIRIFYEKQLFAITCPASNVKLASGIAPLCKLDEAGVRIALGTDGPASNNALDLFREIYLAATLQKVLVGDAAAMDAKKILLGATSVGAHAMGLSDCADISVGQRADLVLIDADAANLAPKTAPVKALVYSAGVQNVRMTMVNGRVLYRDGAYYVGESEELIRQKAQAIAERIEGEM